MAELKEYLEKIEKVIAQGPYKDTWESLGNHPMPDWFVKAKFGRLQRSGLCQ